MLADDITIEVRSEVFGRLGQIDLRLVTDLKIIKRFNNVGSWSLSLPAEYPMAVELAKPGRGLVVEGPEFTLLSGSMINYTKKQNSNDPMGTISFVGVDDNIHLADALAWPQPGNDDVETQNVSHDVRTGIAETIMKGYVSDNIGPTSPPSRRIAGLTIETDQLRGNLVTGRSRFEVLGRLLADIGAWGVGGVGFDINQLDDELVFSVFEPRNLSRLIRMDVINDTLDEVENTVAAPTATRAIGAGQGQGADRRFMLVTDQDALAAEVLWKRKIERFYDRRDTEDDEEILQEGMDIIETEGRTITSLAVRPADANTMIYGVHWYLGDIVGVIVEDVEMSAVVTEAVISVNADGVTVAATVGDPTGFDFESQMIATQKNQEARLAFLEKNAESASELPEVPWTKLTPTTIPEANLPARLTGPGETVADWNDAIWNGFYSGHSASHAPVPNISFNGPGSLDWMGQVIRIGDVVKQMISRAEATNAGWEFTRISTDGGETWGLWENVGYVEHWTDLEGYLASGIDYNADGAVDMAGIRARRVGPMAEISLGNFIVDTMDVPTNGNVVNRLILTGIPAKFRPLGGAAVTSAWNGRVWSGHITPTGDLLMDAVAPTATAAGQDTWTNQQYSGTATYLVARPTGS